MIPPKVIETQFCALRDSQTLIKRLHAAGHPYFVRQTREITSVIVGDKEFIFPSKENHFKAGGLWIFGQVKKDVMAFLEAHPGFYAPKAYPTNATNYNYKGGLLCGTDINHAYWTIAKDSGFISEKTYLKGLEPKFKVTRLAAISVLGRRKVYTVFEGKNKKGEVVQQEEDPLLKEVFKSVRHTCFSYMAHLQKKLGKGFYCYRTDGIFYEDTPKNRKIVQDYFDSKGLSWKQLVYSEEQKKRL